MVLLHDENSSIVAVIGIASTLAAAFTASLLICGGREKRQAKKAHQRLKNASDKKDRNRVFQSHKSKNSEAHKSSRLIGRSKKSYKNSHFSKRNFSKIDVSHNKCFRRIFKQKSILIYLPLSYIS